MIYRKVNSRNNNDLPNKLDKSVFGITNRLKNFTVDCLNSNLTMQVLLQNGSELFAVVFSDTDSVSYVHSTDNGNTWTTVWSFKPSEVGIKNSFKTYTNLLPNNISILYGMLKVSDDKHLVKVNFNIQITTAFTGDTAIIKIPDDYIPDYPVFFPIVYWQGVFTPLYGYIDTNGYIHIFQPPGTSIGVVNNIIIDTCYMR